MYYGCAYIERDYSFYGNLRQPNPSSRPIRNVIIRISLSFSNSEVSLILAMHELRKSEKNWSLPVDQLVEVDVILVS